LFRGGFVRTQHGVNRGTSAGGYRIGADFKIVILPLRQAGEIDAIVYADCRVAGGGHTLPGRPRVELDVVIGCAGRACQYKGHVGLVRLKGSADRSVGSRRVVLGQERVALCGDVRCLF
jgi:hypothetical protein